jgi:hypothetical protein
VESANEPFCHERLDITSYADEFVSRNTVCASQFFC